VGDQVERDDAIWVSHGLAAPARRALVNAGITTLPQLASRTRQEVTALHGMGAHAMARLDDALAAEGRCFAE
jgi:hypothetical protein